MLGDNLTSGTDSFVVFRDGSWVNGSHFVVSRFGGVDRSTCYERKTRVVVDCAPLVEWHQHAREQLEMSDVILQGDLVRALGQRQAHR